LNCQNPANTRSWNTNSSKSNEQQNVSVASSVLCVYACVRACFTSFEAVVSHDANNTTCSPCV